MAGFPEVGDTQTLTLEVNDEAGAPVDPATLTITIDLPTGARIVETLPHANITKTATGRFERVLTYTEPGMWRYRWSTTGPIMGEGERINVRASTLDALPFSLSLEELKRRVDHKMDIDEDLLADDLAAAVLAAQAPPPMGTGRLLIPDPARDTDPAVTRVLTSTRRRVRIPDARTITAVSVDGTVTTAFTTLLHRGLVVQMEFSEDGRWVPDPGSQVYSIRTVGVTGRFGFAQVPIDLAGAIYQLAARWHYERQAQYADQVEVMEGTAVQAYFRQLPPRVKLVFAAYAVPAAVGGLR
jgi:hypothetical protein